MLNPPPVLPGASNDPIGPTDGHFEEGTDMTVERAEVVSIGSRFSGQALLDQADVSLAIVAADLAELKKYGWSDAKTKNLESLRAAVKAGIARYGGAKEAIPVATAKQSEAVAAAKLWLRRAVPMAKNALEGVADLDSFLKMGDISTVPKLGRALVDKVGILKRNAKLVAAEGISADFIKEGEKLSEALSSAEGAQEKERKSLPKEGEEYSFQKGQLHRALKALNRCGQAAFADDTAHKGKYTFEVLMRKSAAKGGGKGKKEAVGAGTA